MERLPDYKKMSEEELDKELELYGLYYGVELYAEPYENGYYFRDLNTDVLVGYYEWEELFNGYGAFNHVFGAKDSIKSVKKSTSLLMKKFKGEKESLYIKFGIITGCALVAGFVLVVGAYKTGQKNGAATMKTQMEMEYEVDYNLPATYSISDAPLCLLRDWADFAYGEWSEGKINSPHEKLVEKANSIYEGPYIEFMGAYYDYFEICEEAAYFPNSEERILEAEQYVRFLASQLELDMDNCIPFNRSPYAYVTDFNCEGVDQYSYAIRLDKANKYLLNEPVLTNGLLSEGISIGEDDALYITIDKIRELNNPGVGLTYGN